MFEIKIEGLEELLHIPQPWYIDGVNFHVKEKQLDVYVKFEKSALFRCSACGELNPRVKDLAAKGRTWRHLNFFEYPCYLHAELSQIDCEACNRTMRVYLGHEINPDITLHCLLLPLFYWSQRHAHECSKPICR